MGKRPAKVRQVGNGESRGSAQQAKGPCIDDLKSYMRHRAARVENALSMTSDRFATAHDRPSSVIVPEKMVGFACRHRALGTCDFHLPSLDKPEQVSEPTDDWAGNGARHFMPQVGQTT